MVKRGEDRGCGGEGAVRTRERSARLRRRQPSPAQPSPRGGEQQFSLSTLDLDALSCTFYIQLT